MNFFFGIKTNTFFSRLTIPRFQNRNATDRNINLYQAFADNNLWKVEILNNIPSFSDFFFVDENLSNNSNIFFLATKKEASNFNKDNLINIVLFEKI